MRGSGFFGVALMLGLLFVLTPTACNQKNGNGDSDEIESPDQAEGISEEADDLESGAEEEPADLIDDTESDRVETEEAQEEDPFAYVCDGGFRVTKVSGWVIDENDNPVEEVPAGLCVVPPVGSDSCLTPQRTNADGFFEVTVPAAKQCVIDLSIRFAVADPEVSILACPVEIGFGGERIMGQPARMVRLPDNTRDALVDENELHDITAPDGTILSIRPSKIMVFAAGYEDVRVLPWDVDRWGWPCFVDHSDPPDGLVTLLPEAEITEEGSALLSFPNVHQLPAGTEVDFFGLGGISAYRWNGEHITEGHWVVISEGAVSEDGTVVSTSEDQGLPFLTWAGYKRRQ